MSRFSVVESVRHLIEQYRSFIKSSYRLADPNLREQFERHVESAEVLVKGPYVTLARDFAEGQRLKGILKAGCGHADLARLNWAFGDAHLYAHQEDALKASESGRNVIVKTGTGSGKTEAFLLPVLSGVLRMKAEGVQGTKAILLYPMNALANDQLVRLRNLFRNSETAVTFALYTGDSETVASTLGEPLEHHELVRRDEIRRNPPDILLTNYKQLEFLLVRKADRVLFTSALRYIVLDELHSYRGALATELACLLRRLKARCDLTRGDWRAIGTSATVSQDAGGDATLARFAHDLFDEPFEASDIIGERYRDVPPAAAPYEPLLPELTSADVGFFTHSDEGGLVRLAEKLCGRKAPETGTAHEKLGSLLAGNRLVEALAEAASVPRTLEEIAETLRQRLPAMAEAPNEHVLRLIEAYLLIGSYGDDEAPPLLRPKLHTFFHGVYDVGLCMNPDCRRLVTDGSDRCVECGGAIRPAVLCRTCGQDFVKVTFEPDHPEQTVADEDFLSDEDTAFITPSLIGERGEDDDNDDVGDADGEPRGRRRRRTAARERTKPCFVDHVRGQLFEIKPIDVPDENLSVQHVLRGRGSTCPVCNSRYARGDVLTLLRTGVASSVSVLATHHLDRVPEGERKLLVFADNRQDAAHQAGYMTDRHRQFALRHAIEQAVRDVGKDGIALQDLPNRVLEIFQKIGLARRNLTRDEAAYWRLTLEYEVAGEFCRAAHQRVALENLALVEAQYEFLDRLEVDARFVECCRRAGLDAARGATLVRAILDFMRRKRAVSFDFYQRFLDPRKTPWSWLTTEPYNLSVAEHERGAVFFMFDRPEALRRSVSGIKMEPLVKDVQRGATGGIAKLVYDKIGLGNTVGEEWIRRVVELLRSEEYGVLEVPDHLPETVRRHIRDQRPVQIAKRVIRLRTAEGGWRCRKCAIWRPYHAEACLASTTCSGRGDDIQPRVADRSNYYVRLYTEDRPRRMRSVEHTAQIDHDTRAKREQEFKDGRIAALVCSPTLELGVDIGTLYSVLMRNAPHTPANYVQRAGRAGRRLRIGFATTFCGTGPHDRHCFEDPAWLVRGEFKPPVVRLSNQRIVARHVRSLALEEMNEDFSWVMGDLLEDVQNPAELRRDRYLPLLEGLRARSEEVGARAAAVFADGEASNVVAAFPDDLEATVQSWHEQVKRLHQEFLEYARIVPSRETEQKRRARQRAYRELTEDRQKAFVLSYLAEIGVLPSYQFPTDTFSLDPGVGDTPTLRRPAWIALFEFAPGNMVYANGHKLKSIRAFFEGSRRSGAAAQSADQSGRVERFYFCGECGFASNEVANDCPQCRKPIARWADVALIDAFEAEENTQITSAEDNRQRLLFKREEHVLAASGGTVQLYPYEFATLEFRTRANLLVTNEGRQSRANAEGEQFDLCPNCGRHRPHGLTNKKLERWTENHRGICDGAPRRFVLGYAFSADVLLLPIAAGLAPPDKDRAKAFCRTLGKALVVGAQELLEIEPDEIAYFQHPDGAGGWTLTFYETASGGAGYLEQLAVNLRRWSTAAADRLFNHDCERACYRCLKSARNQFDHALLNKELVRSTLFHFAEAEATGPPTSGTAGEGQTLSARWVDSLIAESEPQPTAGTPIELALLSAIRDGGRLPEPVGQHSIGDNHGGVLTIPDFAYPERKIAIYCDGFAYHGERATLESDARKRNELQASGWSVLVFWGRQILRNPEACEAQIWRCFQGRVVAQQTSAGAERLATEGPNTCQHT